MLNHGGVMLSKRCLVMRVWTGLINLVMRNNEFWLLEWLPHRHLEDKKYKVFSSCSGLTRSGKWCNRPPIPTDRKASISIPTRQALSSPKFCLIKMWSKDGTKTTHWIEDIKMVICSSSIHIFTMLIISLSQNGTALVTAVRPVQCAGKKAPQCANKLSFHS